jgi:hypothetical protein
MGYNRTTLTTNRLSDEAYVHQVNEILIQLLRLEAEMCIAIKWYVEMLIVLIESTNPWGRLVSNDIAFIEV